MFYTKHNQVWWNRMNILPVNNYKTAFFNLNNNPPRATYPNFGLKMPAQLNCDTVSFGAVTPKIRGSHINDIPRPTAKKIYDVAVKRQKRIEVLFNELFGDMVATEYLPYNPIKELKGRPKKVNSIIDKVTTLIENFGTKWEKKDYILENLTDLNGMKIILRDGSRKSVNTILERFSKAIKEGKLELVEVENKRPSATQGKKRFNAEKYDYATVERVQEFVSNAEKHQKNKVNYKSDKPDYTEVNYTALHFLFKIPGTKYSFEVQLMGHDVSIYKDLDDIFYKILNGKNVDPKYQKIIDIIAPLNDIGNTVIKEQFNRYRGNVFLFQREKAPHIGKHTEYFLPIKDEIKDPIMREKLDMNNLYKIFLECQEEAKKSKKS